MEPMKLVDVDREALLDALRKIARGKVGGRHGPFGGDDAQRIARETLVALGLDW